MKLGVNIDHVATLRQARGGDEPDILMAAQEALKGGADGITVHLREDRRHIQDKDVVDLRHRVPRLNLEMAVAEKIVQLAEYIKPDFCCIVPERRAELTTEGGVDVLKNQSRLHEVIRRLQAVKIHVSLFINPDRLQIEAARDVRADFIEIHTGKYASAAAADRDAQLDTIRHCAEYAVSLGLNVNAGHGLTYHNVKPVAQIGHIEELNIGHSIISRALWIGLESAVHEMKRLMLS